MRALWWMTLAASVACKPLPPRGTVPVEHAGGLPRLVLLPDDAAPLLDLSATFTAGSVTDPIGHEGLAALTVHALAAGGAGDRTPDALREALTTLGATLEVGIGRELATVRLRCASEGAEGCVDLFADLVTRPALDEAAVEAARSALDAVGTSRMADPGALAAAVLDAWSYEAHPYAHPEDGRAGSLPLIDAAEVRAFYASHMVRASTVIGMAGPLPAARVEHLMERLRALPASLPHEVVLMSSLPVSGRALLVVGDGGAAQAVRLGAPLTVTRADADWPALQVAFDAIGAALSADLRDGSELEAALGVSGPGMGRRQEAWSVSWIPAGPSATAPTVTQVLDVLERRVRDGLTPEAVDEAKARVLAELPCPDAGACLASATDAVATGIPDAQRVAAGVIRALSADRVNASLRQHVDPSRLRVVVVGGDPQAVADALSATPGLGAVSVRTTDGLFR